MKVSNMNHLSALKEKLRKSKNQFIAEHEFKSTSELPLSREELGDAVELNKIISIIIHEKVQFPTFQFDGQGQINPVLKEHLPRLLNSGRSGWDICFWLFTAQSITLKKAVPNAAILRATSVQEMLELSKRAAELTERYIGRPIDAATIEDAEVFAACVEHLLNPDYRKIPEKSVDWKAYIGALRAQ